jgi:hypothetical protein
VAWAADEGANTGITARGNTGWRLAPAAEDATGRTIFADVNR